MTVCVVTWVGDDDIERGARLQEALTDAGCVVTGQAQSFVTLRRLVAEHTPDVLVLAASTLNFQTVADIQRVYGARPTPIVAFVDRSTAEVTQAAIQAGVSSYVIDGFAPHRIGPVVEAAIARFVAWQSLTRECERTAAQLVERKLIERAKGILMRRRNLPEDGAYQALRRMAMDRGKRLSQVAQDIVQAEALLNSR